MKGTRDYVIGMDFGTASVRALLLDGHTGQQISAAESAYPRWTQGLYCDPSKNQFRQHPMDYIESLKEVMEALLAPVDAEVIDNIRALSIDTTGSTPGPVDQQGVPLGLREEFSENPNALFFLWKDHTAVKEAAAINQHATNFDINYLQYVGGIYSSEWYWSKLLYALRADPTISKACYTWVEHSDWMPFLLTGGQDATQIKRNVCAAGHKALWSQEFGGFPPAHFFESLDPLLQAYRERLPETTYTADKPAGQLSPEWAAQLGLSTEVLVGVGALDAHFGAVGGQIKPYYMSKVMGTSTCDMIVAPLAEIGGNLVRGISGQVEGSIIPGMLGMEAGQSAFGDIYAWFRQVISWPLTSLLKKSLNDHTADADSILKELKSNILSRLSEEAEKLPLEEQAELSIDWMNGRRTPDANHLLTGAIHGLTLGSDAPRIFRSLVEATCFGSKRIVERFQEEGVPVIGIIAVGGVAKKSPFVMQMMADVLTMPIKVHQSEQTSALGAGMFAATLAGIYPRVADAMQHMAQDFEKEYLPDSKRSTIYAARYEQYKKLAGYLSEASTSDQLKNTPQL